MPGPPSSAPTSGRPGGPGSVILKAPTEAEPWRERAALDSSAGLRADAAVDLATHLPHLGVHPSPAAPAALRTVPDVLPAAARAMDPGDAGPDNTIETADGLVLLDFEFADTATSPGSPPTSACLGPAAGAAGACPRPSRRQVVRYRLERLAELPLPAAYEPLRALGAEAHAASVRA
ncbi:hypothetical protein [Cryptosporangium japonicum]|uniref:Aminoglycoside phosphotransferase domain-containing protein n=1 Tax=Cryptosporangium japonicum TaxID=80872 RepID=A0ABN0UZL5_9ACTN